MVPAEQAKPMEAANGRTADAVTQTESPYRFLCGKTSVELQFAQQDAPSLERLLREYLIRKQAQHYSD